MACITGFTWHTYDTNEAAHYEGQSVNKGSEASPSKAARMGWLAWLDGVLLLWL